MIASLSVVAASIVLALSVSVYLRLRKRSEAFDRLSELANQSTQRTKKSLKSISGQSLELSGFEGRFGKAGFNTPDEKRRTALGMILLFSILTLLGVSLAFRLGPMGLVLGATAGAYIGFMVCLFYLRRCRADTERETLFQLPLILESVILLVEAGMGILPALEKVSCGQTEAELHNPVIRVLRLVYQLSARGMTLAQALEVVADASDQKALRHVLLHLDVSSSEGGALVPSLRALSDHAHIEWRLSVESRVSRLEGLVVFPVFTSVIGLMILTAAVPLVPVLEFMATLEPNAVQIERAQIGR